jgi:hypothetical protein
VIAFIERGNHPIAALNVSQRKEKLRDGPLSAHSTGQ